MKIARILFASDLHGSTLVFKKLINTGINNKVDAILIGGDITGKTLTPIVKRVSGKYELRFLGKTRVINDFIELNQIEADIANSGSYSIIVDEDEYLKLEQDAEYRKSVFLNKMKLRLKQWIALAEEKLNKTNIQFVIICGNDDDKSLDSILNNSSFALNPEQKSLIICDYHEVIGESTSNLTPFHCARDVDESVILKNLTDKVESLKDIGRSILIIHTPPYDTNIDKAPELDKNLKPILQGGHMLYKSVGSTSVREIIEKYQPMLTLHGHIHESSGFCKIGRTYCFNPGSEYSNACLRAYLVTFDRDSVRGHFLIKS